jgi:hypothetical protein
VINTGNDAAGGRSSTAAADELSRLRARVAELEQARRAREIASEIEDREREIQGYDRAEQDERAALRAKQSYANYNLNGAVWERAWVEQGVAQEIQSVTEKYAARKQAARDRIAELRKDVDKSETERRAQ